MRLRRYPSTINEATRNYVRKMGKGSVSQVPNGPGQPPHIKSPLAHPALYLNRHPPSVISAISTRSQTYFTNPVATMNTIIIHPFNRAKNTPMHDMSAALIAPVSGWYRKPTPWWIDTFEEVGLQPIVETDEIAEEDDDVIYEPEELAIGDEQAEVVALSIFTDFEPTCKGMIIRSLYTFYFNAFNMIRHCI